MPENAPAPQNEDDDAVLMEAIRRAEREREDLHYKTQRAATTLTKNTEEAEVRG